MHTKFLELVGVRNDEELTATVQNQGRIYAQKIQEYAKQLGDEVEKSFEIQN